MKFPATDIEYAMQAEIDALRSEVERLRDTGSRFAQANAALQDTNEALRSEVERLKHQDTIGLELNAGMRTQIAALRAESERLKGNATVNPNAEQYREAAFRDAIEVSKYQTALKIADDMLSALRTENEEFREEVVRLADTIVDRENAENAKLREATDAQIADRCRLNVEVARLKEALEKIADPLLSPLLSRRDIARAALSKQGE
jgi:chromosome segregation ATPase